MKDKIRENTSCYTYQVEMIVQVLAEDETSANILLEEKGGYVSSRKVSLLESTKLLSVDKKLKLLSLDKKLKNKE